MDLENSEILLMARDYHFDDRPGGKGRLRPLSEPHAATGTFWLGRARQTASGSFRDKLIFDGVGAGWGVCGSCWLL